MSKPVVSTWWEKSIQYPEVRLALLACAHDENVVVLMSNFKCIKVPFEAFLSKSDQPSPDFSKLSIVDWGHTVALGEHQASIEALYEEFRYEVTGAQ